MQLTAPLCCREASRYIRFLPYMQTPLLFSYRHFSAGLRQVAAQLDAAFNTQVFNHLWQPMCTQAGLLSGGF